MPGSIEAVGIIALPLGAGKTVQAPVFTREQAELFAQLCAEMPGAGTIPWESVDIDCINGKRVLCLMYWPPDEHDEDARVYLHYYPVGCTAAEEVELTRRHGMTGCSDLEGNTIWAEKGET